MSIPVIQNAFVSGELDPALFGRTDLEKFHTSASTMRNCFVDYRGGALSRPGTAFVGYSLQTVNSNGYIGGGGGIPPRLIPFQFSVQQGLLLEFGNHYMRVISDGAFVTENALNITHITNASPAVVSATATGGSTATPVNGNVILSYAPGDTVTLAGGAYTVPAQLIVDTTLLISLTVNNAGSAYVPGDTVNLAGGTQTSPAVATVATTQVGMLPIIVNGGTGGTPGTAIVTGTTGTGTLFQASVTITGTQSASPNNGAVTASYAPNDTITLAGGTYTSPAILSVTTTEVLNLTGTMAGIGYAPTQTITLGGGNTTLAPVVTITTTEVSTLPTIVSPGTGGTPGTAIVTGTTGTGTLFQASVTISAGGAITSVNSLTVAGSYTVNPTNPSIEPVTGGGLAGASLDITMGVNTFTFTSGGPFSANPPENTFVQNSTSGSGIGATFLGLFGPDTLTFSSSGSYSVFPSNPVAQGATSGSGAGVTFTITNSSSITAINSVTVPGSYAVNPTVPSAEPVTGGGLTGAVLGLQMGVGFLGISSAGVFTANPNGGLLTQSGTSGGGVGATFQPALFAPLTVSFSVAGTYSAFPPNPVMQASTSGSGIGAEFDISTSAVAAYNNGDWVYLSGIGGMTELNGRTLIVADATSSSFALFDVFGNPVSTLSYPPFTAGGTAARIYTLLTPYAAVDLKWLKYTQSADVMSFACWNQDTLTEYPPMDLTRFADNDWVIAAPTFQASIPAPANLSGTPLGFGDGQGYVYRYVVTAINDATGEESLPSNEIIVANLVLNQKSSGATFPTNVLNWTASAGTSRYNIYGQTPLPAVSNVEPLNDAAYIPTGLRGFLGQAIGTMFVDTGIAPDFSTTPPMHANPFAPGQIIASPVTNGGGGYLNRAQPFASVATSTGSGASFQVSVAIPGQFISSVIPQNMGMNYLPTDTVTINGNGAGAGATATLTVGPETGTYPGVVQYFQERRVYAATENNPDTLFFSQTGLFLNFDTHFPTIASDAITVSPWSVAVNGVQFMVAMPGGLVVLTGSSAWQLTGAGGSSLNPQPISPQSEQAQPQAFNGISAFVPPIKIDWQILYVQAKGSIIREFTYQIYQNIYTGIDLTELSSQLFSGFTIQDWCYAEEPFKVIWAVRNDGVLLSCTYLKAENVWGWARHDTNGQFVSIASVTELPVDAVYVAVERTVPEGSAYLIERFDNRMWDTAEDVWAVDAGLQLAQNVQNSVLTVSSATGSGYITGAVGLNGGSGYSAGTIGIVTDDNGLGPGIGAIPTLTIWGGSIDAVTFPSGVIEIVQSAVNISATSAIVTMGTDVTPGNWLVALVGKWDDYGTAEGWSQAGLLEGGFNDFIGIFYRQALVGDGVGPFSPSPPGGGGETVVIYEISGIGAPFVFDQIDSQGDVVSGGSITVGNGDSSNYANSLQIGMILGQQDAIASPTFDVAWTSDLTSGPTAQGFGGNVAVRAAHRTVPFGGTLDANVTYNTSGNPTLAYVSINFGQSSGNRNYIAPAIDFIDPEGSAGGAGAIYTPILYNGAVATTNLPTFSSGDVGNIIRAGGGIAEITAFTSSVEVTINILSPFTDVVPNSGGIVAQQAANSWTMDVPVTYIGGMYHLIGMTVTGLADGNVIPPQVVAADGSITLGTAASLVTVGLPFTAQVQSVYADGDQPTWQGRRKKASAVTVRINASRGLQAGQNQPDGSTLSPVQVAPAWNSMVAVQDKGVGAYNALCQPLYTGDTRVPLIGGFATPGQVAVQQVYPLPMNIDAFVLEILTGDTPEQNASSPQQRGNQLGGGQS